MRAKQIDFAGTCTVGRVAQPKISWVAFPCGFDFGKGGSLGTRDVTLDSFDHGAEKCEKTPRLSLDFHGINLGDRYE
jgi:hypothetical protein